MGPSDQSINEYPSGSTDALSNHSTDRTHVQLDHIVKNFTSGEDGEVVAVDDLSLDIRENEFLVLVGPSGCGKTTTLRILAGLETATEGDVYINDANVTNMDPRQRDIAMVFQSYALYPHKTVRENLAFPLSVRNYSAGEIEERVEDTAELLSITNLLPRKPKELSGGQQQRVALGRALVRQPSVFLLDEPLSNLDAKLRIQMRTELNELHKQVGNTTVYVTHNQGEAMTLGDRVVVMKDGTIQQVGRPQTLYDNPINQFVAGFIGEPPMNLIDVEINEISGSYIAKCALFEIDLTEQIAQTTPNQEITDLESTLFGVRPEDLHDAALVEATNDSSGVFEALVRIVEPMGSDNFLTLSPTEKTNNSTSTQNEECTARVSPESDVSEGDVKRITINLNKIHLFDVKTGQNLSIGE